LGGHVWQGGGCTATTTAGGPNFGRRHAAVFADVGLAGWGMQRVLCAVNWSSGGFVFEEGSIGVRLLTGMLAEA
jgi:hypothetical protein